MANSMLKQGSDSEYEEIIEEDVESELTGRPGRPSSRVAENSFFNLIRPM